MVRRTRRWRAPQDEYDFVELFVVEAKKIVRYSALLSAYRASTGVYIRADRSAFALERLAQAAEDCAASQRQSGRTCLMSAMEHAAKVARLSYTGQWWTATLRNGPPADMNPGDEYFSWRTVRETIEHMREPVPDVAIEAGSLRPPRVRAAPYD